MTTYHFPVIIEQDEDGLFVAECPTFQGCYTQASTYEQALVNIREVIEMCVRELTEEGRLADMRIPETYSFTQVAVAVGA